MSEYSRINCKCGHSYMTKDFFSTCPNCKETNYSTNGKIAFVLVIAVIGLFIALVCGSPGWVYYSYKNKTSYWHSVGALVLGIFSFYVMYQMYIDNYPGFGMIGMISNSLGILGAGYLLFKSASVSR